MSVDQQLVKIIHDFGDQIAEAFQQRQLHRSGLQQPLSERHSLSLRATRKRKALRNF